MANVTWQRTGALLRKLFEILQAEAEGLPAGVDRLFELWVEFYPKLDDLARERLPLTPETRGNWH